MLHMLASKLLFSPNNLSLRRWREKKNSRFRKILRYTWYNRWDFKVKFKTFPASATGQFKTQSHKIPTFSATKTKPIKSTIINYVDVLNTFIIYEYKIANYIGALIFLGFQICEIWTRNPWMCFLDLTKNDQIRPKQIGIRKTLTLKIIIKLFSVKVVNYVTICHIERKIQYCLSILLFLK
jgi:hypothetical protein